MRFRFLLFLLTVTTMAGAQSFKPVQVNPFGINIPLSPFFINDMQFADLTQDGAFDIIFNDSDQGPFILVNDGVPGIPNFSGVAVKSFYSFNDNQVGEGTFTDPTTHFFDLDGDGDLDILGNISSDIVGLPAEYLFTKNSPEMVTPDYLFFYEFEEFPGSDIGLPFLPYNSFQTYTFGDLDADGDQDILANQYFDQTSLNTFVFYESIAGTSGIQMFNGSAVDGPFGLPMEDADGATFGYPGLMDPDGDGDLDLFVSAISGDWFYFENTGTATATQFSDYVVNPFGLTPLSNPGAPYFMDVNMDGQKDLLCGAGTEVYYFEFAAPSAVANGKTSKIELTLQPNPAHDYVIVSAVHSVIAEISFLNASGQTVWHSDKGNGNSRKITLGDDFAPGIYWVKARMSNGEWAMERVVKD